jgi:hypothetical protein
MYLAIQFAISAKTTRHLILPKAAMLTAAARPAAARLFPQSLATVQLRRTMGTIADGVEFDTIAREWRCKVRQRRHVRQIRR